MSARSSAPVAWSMPGFSMVGYHVGYSQLMTFSPAAFSASCADASPGAEISTSSFAAATDVRLVTVSENPRAPSTESMARMYSIAARGFLASAGTMYGSPAVARTVSNGMTASSDSSGSGIIANSNVSSSAIASASSFSSHDPDGQNTASPRAHSP